MKLLRKISVILFIAVTVVACEKPQEGLTSSEIHEQGGLTPADQEAFESAKEYLDEKNGVEDGESKIIPVTGPGSPVGVSVYVPHSE